MKLLAKAARTAAFSLFLVANPAYVTACADSEPSESTNDPFTYGESDMLALMEGVNSTERWLVPEYEVELSLTQSEDGTAALLFSTPPLHSAPKPRKESFVRSAHACETRTFIKSAAACIDMTELLVKGTLRLYERSEEGARVPVEELQVRGEIRVTSLNLTHAELNLSFEGGSAFLVWNDVIGDEFALQQLNASDVGEDEDTIAYSSDH